jgi:hypothetical protein
MVRFQIDSETTQGHLEMYRTVQTSATVPQRRFIHSDNAPNAGGKIALRFALIRGHNVQNANENAFGLTKKQFR